MATSARRSKGTGSIRLRPDGRYEGRITIAGKPFSVYGRTEAEVGQELDRIRLEHGTPATELSDGAAGDPKLGDFLVEWLAARKASVESTTYLGYEHVVTRHLAPGLGQYRLSELTPKHVEVYIARKLEWGMAPRSVYRHRAILRGALTYALRHGLVVRNVAALAEPPKVDVAEISPLSPEEARQFLTIVRDDPVGPIFIVVATCGLRASEVLGLAWKDVDLEAGTLSVRQTLHRVRGEYVLRERAKTVRSRRILSLPRVALDALAAWREKCGIPGGDELVFRGVKGSPVNNTWLTLHLQRLLRLAGLPRQTTHGLRHLTASLLLASGLSLYDVARTLGHSQIGLTANLYGHWYDQSRQKVADHMDRILGQGTGSDTGSTGEGSEGDASAGEGLRA